MEAPSAGEDTGGTFRRRLLPLLLLFLLAASPSTAPTGPIRYLDIYLDPAGQPLAAWQFELKAGEARIVGLEGGEAPGFQDPPYHDPAAINQGRIIVAAFSTGPDLPSARTRIARLHLVVPENARPAYDLKLIAAGSREGKPIPARISFTEGEAR